MEISRTAPGVAALSHPVEEATGESSRKAPVPADGEAGECATDHAISTARDETGESPPGHLTYRETGENVDQWHVLRELADNGNLVTLNETSAGDRITGIVVLSAPYFLAFGDSIEEIAATVLAYREVEVIIERDVGMITVPDVPEACRGDIARQFGALDDWTLQFF